MGSSNPINANPVPHQMRVVGGVLENVPDEPAGSALAVFDWEYASECSVGGYAGGADCDVVQNDGIDWAWSDAGPGGDQSGNYTEVVAAAANSGNYGLRVWHNDGQNNQTYPVRYVPPTPLPKFWVRYYVRYQAGYQWSGGLPGYDKHFYCRTGGGLDFLPQPVTAYSDYLNKNVYWAITLQGHTSYYRAATDALDWADVFGSVSDGLFHMIEFQVKMDTDGTDGELRMWIDGNLAINETGVDISEGDTVARQGVIEFEFPSNQNSPANGGVAYVDFDDIEIWNTTPPNIDSSGNPYIGPKDGFLGGNNYEPSMSFTQSFLEECNDNSFLSRGWYDGVEVNTVTMDADNPNVNNSTNSVECLYPIAGTNPTWSSMRKDLTPTDNVYVSLYVKYSSNWQGSNLAYHPHEFYFLTNKDGDYAGLYGSELTLYVEQNELTPRLAFSNPSNIDGVFHDSPSVDMQVDKWHKVEAFFKLNTMTGNVGNNDGIFKYWLDRNLLIDENTVMMREGASNTDMLIDQFIIAPWIGDGSPVAQTMWIDQIIIGTE